MPSSSKTKGIGGRKGEEKREVEEERKRKSKEKRKREKKRKKNTLSYPGGDPISFETVCLSMNSDMSSLTMASSLPK
mgnify:FL=1|jgi:hypothetical protein